MSWSDLLRVAAFCLVAGCGFTPVYGPGGPGAALRDAVTVEAGETVLDYRLRVALEDRLGTGSAYRLAVATRVDEVQAAVTSEGTITRFNLVGVAEWVLRDAAGAEVARGEVRGLTGYLTTGSTVATEAAARDASGRLAVILADQIVARLAMAMGAG
jgi:LPS-assembly lipoprotein